LLNKFSNEFETTNAKIKEVKIASPVIYGVMPALSNEEQRIVTKAADAYFKDKSLPANLTVVDQESGKTQGGSELEAYTVKKYGYDWRTRDWVLTMEGEVNDKKDIKTVRLSANQVSNPIISKWQNSSGSQLAMDILNHDAGVKGEMRQFSKNEIDASGNRTGRQIVVRVYSEGAGAPPLVELYNPETNETSSKMKSTDKEVAEIAGTNAKTGMPLFE
jgi:hypothetical protein